MVGKRVIRIGLNHVRIGLVYGSRPGWFTVPDYYSLTNRALISKLTG